jgi:copper resistance protein C
MSSILSGIGAIGVLALATAAPADAHSFLVDASPSAKDHVASAPKTIKLRFGAGVEPAYSKLTIETGDGKVLAQGAVGKPDNPRELTLNAPSELPPARYIVRYRVLSTDGHIVEGNYEFTVDGK